MLQANLGRALLEKLADERGLSLSKRALLSHWIYLKLRLSFCKLTDSAAEGKRATALTSATLDMFVSVARSEELKWSHKMQHMAWAFSVAVLPALPARKLIRYAFDTSPKAGLVRFLRRA